MSDYDRAMIRDIWLDVAKDAWPYALLILAGLVAAVAITVVLIRNRK